VRQKDAYPAKPGAVSYNYVQHTAPPPSRATFPSLIARLYLLDSGIENDVSARLPNITSATCHLEL